MNRIESGRRCGLANKGRKYVMTEEHRRAITEARRAQGSPWATGRRRSKDRAPLSEEHRQKISETKARRGATRTFTDEDRERSYQARREQGHTWAHQEAIRLRAERRLMGRDDVEWAPGYIPGVARPEPPTVAEQRTYDEESERREGF